MKGSRSQRRPLLFCAIILLALFIYRPGANGLRKRIVNSVGMALGRKVDVDWVKVRILPQPGFDLVNFVVHDDPSFSAEPMLRAQEVTAALRLRSLLRGRFEIGRLSLKEPSFNLVRRDDGHWNVESLLERAAHTPVAPTSHTKPEA
ncbi:MAG TPA: AsmA family protein, partial [Terriglobales bacterium]|nr:AsmA family protein [Terriglobales bacterium]